jgi:arylformamidase
MKYTQEFCDREYNARAAIPDHPQIFARWADQAAATRRLRACLLDLPYGDTEAERLDLFPAPDDHAPLLVFIHGGWWRSLDKSDFSWVAPPFVQRGIAVALPNYGLAPGTPLEDIVRQILKALAWLHRHAGRYGLNRGSFVVAGHSAGAHLAAMMMAAQWEQYASDLLPALVKGALGVSGVYDLEPLVHAPFVNVDLKLDAARARRLSPAHMPAPGHGRLITAVGEQESSEFRRQTALIGQRWKSRLVRQVPMHGYHHLSVIDELTDQTSPLFDAALDLVRGP